MGAADGARRGSQAPPRSRPRPPAQGRLTELSSTAGARPAGFAGPASPTQTNDWVAHFRPAHAVHISSGLGTGLPSGLQRASTLGAGDSCRNRAVSRRVVTTPAVTLVPSGRLDRVSDAPGLAPEQVRRAWVRADVAPPGVALPRSARRPSSAACAAAAVSARIVGSRQRSTRAPARRPKGRTRATASSRASAPAARECTQPRSVVLRAVVRSPSGCGRVGRGLSSPHAQRQRLRGRRLERALGASG